MNPFEIEIQPDFEGLRRCILRQGEPERVHNIELLLDEEIISEIASRFDLVGNLDLTDPHYRLRRDTVVHRFLGYDIFPVAVPGFEFTIHWNTANKTHATNDHPERERNWIEEHRGPIGSWSDFEQYPWPDLKNLDTRPLEWCEKNLPEGMAVYCWNDQVFERLFGLFGYENLCLKLCDEPELVEAVAQKAGQLCVGFTEVLCQFSRVGAIFDSDDLGFRSQTLLSPEWLRILVLPWHKESARIAHEHRKLYFLHSCGNVDALMEDFIEDVGVDAKHSFEDAIMPVTEAKRRYGHRIGILGGIDVDFLCRQDEQVIRERVRETLEVCQPGGGYVLGSGNSIPNFMPLDHYLAMLDEGRKFGRG
ncbi:MAG: hypothetical protein JW818_13445 [Pirellulales bacterium]|nr:hypothetical protein [Pirellulales bacterium]